MKIETTSEPVPAALTADETVLYSPDWVPDCRTMSAPLGGVVMAAASPKRKNRDERRKRMVVDVAVCGEKGERDLSIPFSTRARRERTRALNGPGDGSPSEIELSSGAEARPDRPVSSSLEADGPRSTEMQGPLAPPTRQESADRVIKRERASSAREARVS